ncbi:Hydroxamate-type ferrichrome siderophore peptide synthetase [Talaromyces islandicus]|uniref:Nonribosomal peptide synthetase sidC n=1 Tax=Talaromyces islandicus TaxID=28573 RepID=A0A0U1M5X0_TALIS|nr:Hydroxamate-type ferrichrome siderophore peptide synthetase [Talaromyces islandicus]
MLQPLSVSSLATIMDLVSYSKLLTQFPDIYPSDHAVHTEIPWSLLGVAAASASISVETVVLSWAALLHAYTGEEQPVLTLNQHPVSVQIAQKNIINLKSIHNPEETETPFFTGIVIQQPTEHSLFQTDAPRITAKCALSCSVDLVTGAGFLKSEVGILPCHLKQLAGQLLQFVGSYAGLGEAVDDGEKPLLSIVNPDPQHLQGPQFLHELAFHHTYRDAPALEFLKPDHSVHSISFEDLDCLSTQLAHQIARSLGPNPSSRIVPVFLGQSAELYIAWLAVLKAGAAFCPLGIDSPEDRISFILKDVAAEVVVTSSKFRTKLASTKAVSLVLVDNLEVEHVSSLLDSPDIVPEDLAYVMYTSGSTGRPKGVTMSHQAVTQSLLAHDSLIPPFRRFLQFASPTFDVSVFEVFFPWFRGATLVGADRSIMLYDLPNTINMLQVDAAELTPTVAAELLRSRQSVPSLQVLLTIGEMLTKRVVDEFGTSTTDPGILHGMYGPTEAAIHCTAAPNFQSDSRVNLIGQPLKTVSAFVMSLDENTPSSEPVILPIGHIGELVVGGPQLANGYINRPVENSKAFLRSSKYGRLYRTGDKARFLPDGSIECLGRISAGQVKLRGQRVELGEIENVICLNSQIRSAVVGVVQGILIAWLLIEEGEDVQPEKMRQFCLKRLPPYMVPGDFIILREFPRLDSGKVDKKTLEANYTQIHRVLAPDSERQFRDTLEEDIAKTVSNVLKTSNNYVDSLSAAGLDSLTGIRLAARLREIGVNLDVGAILTADTVSEIWELSKGASKTLQEPSDQKTDDDEWNSVINTGMAALDAKNIHSQAEKVEPCSDTQLAMLSESLRDCRAYCNWVELEFRDGLQLTAVRQAFSKLIEYNEMLRSVFLRIDLPNHPFCRVVWKTSNLEDYFQEPTSFERDWSIEVDNSIFVPLRVQFLDQISSIRVLVQIHHTIYDGWSWELLLDDLASALREEHLDVRPSYSGVVRHDFKSASSKSSKRTTSYWEDQLRGAIPSTLPSFQSRYDIPTKIGQVCQNFTISLAQVDEQARSLSISRQTFFQATLAYILSSYLDTTDVMVGTVFSGRTLPVEGIEATIGPCLRIFPNRVNLSWVRTIHDLLTAVHRNNRKGLEYGDISLRQIKRLSGVANTSRLFDCLFVWQEVSGNTSRPNTIFEQVASADFLEFPLTIELEPKDGKVTATTTFEESVFPAAQARLLLEQIDHIATLFSHTPDLELGLVNERLPSSVLSIENDQFVHLDDLPSLPHQVEQLAVNDPNRNAVEFLHSLDPDTGSAHAESLTYYDLNQQSNRLAHHIISCGVESGDLVGIILEKSLNLYISILAVVKVGAGYVPLTPSTPHERIRTVLEETQPRLCIFNSSIHSKLNDLKWLHLLDLESVDILQYPDTNIVPSFQKANMAYVVYTSGSTGKPKGVIITYHNIQSNIAVLAEIYPIGTSPKFLQACSQAFDVSVFEIFFSWHCGMTLCSATNDVMFRDIEEVIRNRGITHLSLTPTVAALIRPENVPNVRLLVTAGEGLTAKVHHDWAGKGLYQGYGPSETTNICTVQPNVTASDNLRNIGKPFKNTSVFVVSGGSEFSLLPRGAVGEFCFGGDQVGQGYLNQPDLTSEKFLNHAQFGRLYRSGDFGRLLPDGSLMFVGRRDDQVKLRGQRVELGEINSAVLRSIQVKDSASMIVGDHPRQQLVTFFVAKTSSKDYEYDDGVLRSLVKSIFEELAADLAPYMVPTYLIPMEAIPMTGVKKIDMRRLKEIFESLASDNLQKFSRFQGKPENSGLTEDEKKVARIISQTTKTPLDLLKANSSLYTIGIDSISAIHVARQLREAGLGQIDVSLILQNGSISELARAVGDKGRQEQLTSQDTDTGKDYVVSDEILREVEEGFQGQHVEMVIPCTALQESMLSRTISKEENAYCNHVLLEFRGDFEKLHHVMQEMARRHEILRTCFATTTSNAKFSFVQVILQQIDLPWVAMKATDLEAEISNRKVLFAQHIQQPRAIPYSLAAITDTQTGKQMLLFSIHHALHDGEAMGLLFKEVEYSYAGIEPPSPTQFREFANYVFAKSHDDIDPFWTEYLHEVSRSLLLPTPEASGKDQSGSIEIRKSKLKISLAEAEASCRGLSVTLLGLLQGAWVRLLSLYTNSSDICFGNVFSGRTTPIKGIESVIGPCFSVLPVRVHVNPTALNLDVVKTAHKANLEIMGYQHTSLRQIQKNFSGKPLFDSIVLLQPPVTELNSELWQLISEEGDMDFPIILELIPSEKQDSISIQLHVNSNQVSSEDADSILKDFADLVIQTLQYPLARANDFDQSRGLPAIAKKARDFKEAASKPKTNGSSDSQVMALMFSDEEVKVRDIVSRLSGCDPQTIRHDTTIFQLGLDSINAIQLSALLRDAGFNATAANILENPSIRQIATLLDSPGISSPVETFELSSFDSEHRQYVESRLNLGDKRIESIRPCTPVQAGMLAEFTKSRGDLYCNRLVLKLKSSIDLSRLKASWSNVVARHEMLRTGFVDLENREFPFAMITYSPGQVSLPWTERQTRPSTDELEQQRHSMYENLHLPPWLIVIRNLPSVVEFELTAMHSLYDAQSMELILSDVAAEYQGHPIHRAVPIPQLLGSILNAALSTNKDIQTFWSDMGSGFQSTSFPNLSPSTVREPAIIVRSQRTSKSLDTINEKCKAIGVTLQAAGQAAWARLLSAYTGETNISFGLVLSGRDVTHDAQDAVFPCLVTLPFNCVIEGRNQDFISSIVKTNASLMKYQFTPLSKIQRLFKADGALVDSLFAYQKLSHTRKEAQLWEVVEDDARVDYPISMEMVPDDEGITLRVTCRSDVVPQEQADLILTQFDYLLADGLLCTDSSCAETSNIQLDLLSVTPAIEPRITSPVGLLHEFVEESARKLPDNTALEFVHGENLDQVQKNAWTYRELDRIGNKVARLLQNLDPSKGVLVAICFDKCPEAYFAILGILKNGNAFVALDPGAPLDRKQFIIQDSRAKLFLSTSDKYQELGKISGVTTVALDTPGILDDISSDQVVLERPIDPDDTCYCLYTSGTTGTPKGCEITHDNAVQAMQAFTRLFHPHWDKNSRWLQFASFHFDVSILEQYWSWSVGICVTSCPRDLLFQDLAGTMVRLGITHVDLTPSLAKLITPEEVPSLCRGVFITGGEALKQEILDAWGKQKVIYNGYGPTEVTIGCTMLPRMDENSKSSNIGPQFDNVGSYVFQPNTTTPVLRGAIGELCISGALVGRGYLNRPDLTREKFQILDEFHERAYRTGDLVRILHDGSFQFLGRIDDQVKIRGQRLEIGEINAVIQKATPEISEVATLVIKHPSQMREQLVAFVARERPDKRQTALDIVKDEKMSEIVASVQVFTKSKLPGYMVPTHIIPISALPLSPNNKVDMKVLKKFYSEISLEQLQQLGSISNGRESINGEDVRAIVRVLAEFAKVNPEEISQSTTIYDLGVDSISVIGLAQKLRDAGFAAAQVSSIMKSPTIAGIASTLVDHKWNKSSATNVGNEHSKQKIKAFAHRYTFLAAESIGITTQSIEDMAPCTPLQAGMIARFLESSEHPYCSLFRFELKPEVDLGQLRKAWSETQAAVQLLRARMVALPDGYGQVFLKHDELPWLEETAEDHDIEAISETFWKAWRDDLHDLSGPLWSLGIVKSPGKRLLCLNIFHALYDGNSLPLLLEQVRLRYRGQQVPGNVPTFAEVLSHGPLQELPQAKEFWSDVLDGVPDKRNFSNQDADMSQSIILTQSMGNIEGLDEMKASLQVTDNSIFHACWLLALYEHLSNVPPLGIVMSGRALDIPGAEHVVGPLFNTVPSHISFRQCITRADLIKTCHHHYISALPFQHTPLRDILKWIRRGSNQPLFEILFVFQKSDPITEDIWSEVDSVAVVDYPLSLEVNQTRQGHVTATLAARCHAFPTEEAEALLSTFREICKTISLEKDTRLPNDKQGDINGLSTAHAPVQQEISRYDKEFDWTPTMTDIRNVIADLAGIDADAVHPEASIFELGLDSIDAVKLSSRLKHRGINLAVSSIMNLRSLLNMSKTLSTTSELSLTNSEISLDQMREEIKASLEKAGKLPENTVNTLPPTALQEAMVAEMMISDYQHYYTIEAFEVDQNVDFSRLLKSWETVIDTHDILRTTFVEIEDPNLPFSYAQIVHAPTNTEIPVFCVQDGPVDNIVEAIVDGQDHSPLVLRAVQTTDKTYIILSIAHALYDGWSLDLLHSDVEKAYFGNHIDRPPYEATVQQILNSSGDSHKKYWDVTLKNLEPHQFPKGKDARGSGSTLHRLERLFDISSEDIAQFCRTHGVTVQTLTLATWSLALAGFVKSLDVCFGLVLSGRNFADADEIMFPTMNTVAFRAILHGSRLDMLKYIQSTLGDLAEHQHYPLRKAGSGITAGPLFDTIFIYQKRPSASPTRPAALYKSVHGSADTGYPLSVEMELLDESMICRLAARDDILGVSDAADILDQISRVFHLILSEPHHATVDFTDDGITVCQSAAFREKSSEQETIHENGDGPEADNTWSELEMKIRGVLSVLSGIPQDSISKDSTLFNLGLDSISAIKVCALLRQQSVVLPVTAMLKAGSIRKMAESVEPEVQQFSIDNVEKAINDMLRGVDVDEVLSSNRISVSNVERILPATSGQTYCLALNAQNPEIFYGNFFYSIDNISRDQLDHAWKRLVAQFPILRTGFIRTGQRDTPFIQRILNEANNSVCWHEADSDSEFLRPKQRPIASGPVSIHAVSASHGVLINLHIHHALYDAVSLPLIIDSLGQLCMGGDVPGNELEFSKFVAFQAVYSPVTARKQFWESYLSGVETKYQPYVNGSSSRRQSFFRPGLVKNVESLELVARHNGLSLQSLFMAVYAKVYSQLIANRRDQKTSTEVEDPVLGIYLANRSYALEGLSDLVAPTLNMVPLRIRQVNAPAIESAHQIQSDLHDISRVEHAGVSLTEIMDWTGVKLDVFVNFLRLPESGNTLERVRISPFEPKDITPEVSERGSNEDVETLNRDEDLARSYTTDCIDVEIAVRDGAMDVGIFGPEALLSAERAERILSDIRKELEQLGRM